MYKDNLHILPKRLAYLPNIFITSPDTFTLKKQSIEGLNYEWSIAQTEFEILHFVLCNAALLKIDGILPKRPYPLCFRMADRALLAGYPRYVMETRPITRNYSIEKGPFDWRPLVELHWHVVKSLEVRAHVDVIYYIILYAINTDIHIHYTYICKYMCTYMTVCNPLQNTLYAIF